MEVIGKSKMLWLVILTISVLSEVLFQTYWRNKFGLYWNPIICMGSGIAVCISSFYLIGIGGPAMKNKVQKSRLSFHNIKIIFYFLFFIFLIVVSVVTLKGIYEDFPIDPKMSDIIPSLQMYVRRFLGGENVYTPLLFEGYQIHPTYLPLLWMPYTLSELLHIDYRYTALLVFIVGIVVHQLYLVKQQLPLLELLLKMSVPFVWLFLIARTNSVSLGLAVELLPVGYYLLMSRSIFNKSIWVIAMGILICLLSRYAFSFWLPLFLIIYWIEKGFPKVFKLSLILLCGVVIIYVIPFASKDWNSLSKGLESYDNVALSQWHTQSWQNENELPHYLTRGHSLSIFFYNIRRLSVEERLKLNKRAHLLVCLLTAMLLFVIYLIYRKKGLDVSIYLLIALKMYLVVFYGFFYVPFDYLYALPLFLTIPIIYQIRFFTTWGEKRSLG